MYYDTISEAKNIIETSEIKGITLRLIGGIGVFYTCPSASKVPFNRTYNDIDMIGLSHESRAITGILNELGYKSLMRFNALYGYNRLIFKNEKNGIKIDIFLDKFEMSHRFDFRSRIHLCKPSVPISDLLMSKLQVVNINEKDIKDALVIFLDHEFGNDPCNNVETEYINKYTSTNWGLYKTFTDNLKKILKFTSQIKIYDYNKEVLNKKILFFSDELENSHKSIIWKMRSIIGARKKWYEDVSNLS
jgi:hypothetical protein